MHALVMLLLAALQVHRHAYGTPGADGWYGAQSTRGGVEVLLPDVYDDSTVTVPAIEGVMEAIVTDNLSCHTKNGATFTAMRTVGGTLVAKTEQRTMQNGVVTLTREKIVDGKLYRMIVTYPVANDPVVAPMAAKFFDSLKIAPGTSPSTAAA